MHHQAHDNRLSDRDILTDLLMTAKQMIGAYGLAERESTHPQLRATLHRLATEEEQFHAQAFQAMHQRGWYETPLADTNLAQQIVTLWSGKMQQYNQFAGQARSGWASSQQDQPTYNQPYAQQQGQQYNQPYGQQYGH